MKIFIILTVFFMSTLTMASTEIPFSEVICYTSLHGSESGRTESYSFIANLKNNSISLKYSSKWIYEGKNYSKNEDPVLDKYEYQLDSQKGDKFLFRYSNVTGLIGFRKGPKVKIKINLKNKTAIIDFKYYDSYLKSQGGNSKKVTELYSCRVLE